jgi:hypothetical protein
MSSTTENASVDKTAKAKGTNAIELPDKRVVQLDELSANDRALAEQFGYQPVSPHGLRLCFVQDSFGFLGV